MNKIILEEKFDKIKKYWDPHIIGSLNGQHLKIAKIKGEFIMHSHEKEDELFMVIKGNLFIEMDGEEHSIHEGEIIIVPRGKDHKPYTKNNEEVWIMMFEPASTVNTGNISNEFTKTGLREI